jgi:hypothetical protein
MRNTRCPTCGHETIPDAGCPVCVPRKANGAVARPKPTPPPEAGTWVIERPSPEILEEGRRTFDEAEYLAGVREIEAGGGHRLEDFIEEIERIANGQK